jgi:hypothetical protein
MTVKLDKKITVANLTVAAVVDVSLALGQCGPAFGCVGHKRPVAILVSRGDKRVAFLPDGTPLSPQELDAICADAWQLFGL